MRYTCNRCKLETTSSGKLVATMQDRGQGTARKFTVFICDDCFNSLIEWFKGKPTLIIKREASPTGDDIVRAMEHEE